MAEIILKAQNLKKNYGDKQVLKGVNLDIRAGEIFGLIGSSGSGKTTLLNSLIGFVSPTSGEIVFRDPHLLSYTQAGEQDTSFRNVLHYPTQVKEIFGFAAQDPSVYGKLTVMENLDLFGSLYNLSKDSRKTNSHILLKLMGLYNSRNFKATNLSGGMLKRLDIACSLIHDPKVLILDEPTADLDPYLRRHMWDLIRKINKKGTTIIISSHYLDEVEELCDRIGIMSNGQIQHYGTPQEIKKIDDGSEEIHIRTEYKRYEQLGKKLDPFTKTYGITQVRTNGAELVIRAKKPLPVVELLLKTAEQYEDAVIDLRLNKPSLNEIFAAFVEENQGGDLTAHQKKLEEESIELTKQKWWYKLKVATKMPFGKKEVSADFDNDDVHKLLVTRKREKRRIKRETQKSNTREREPVSVPKLHSLKVHSRKSSGFSLKKLFSAKPKKPRFNSTSSRKHFSSEFTKRESPSSAVSSSDSLSDLADIRARIEKLRSESYSMHTNKRSRK